MTSHIDRYLREFGRFQDVTERMERAVSARLTESYIAVHAVQSRTKEPDSAAGKFARLDDDGEPVFTDPLREVTDLVGVRVITYLTSDIERVEQALTSAFEVRHRVDRTSVTQSAGTFGYAGTHLILRADDELHFEVQIRTVLQHAWAEIEHGIRYKGSRTTPSAPIDRAFTLAAGLIELADAQFAEVDTLHKKEVEEARATEEIEIGTLQEVLTKALPDIKPARADAYEWLVTLLDANGIEVREDLDDFLAEADVDAVVAAMDYRFEPTHVRLVDDLLLARFGEDHIARTADVTSDRDREPKLRYRLGRLSGRDETD
ncbi:GTP pyrophosphokinase [Williamsia serinedens]|uniref:PpGpp synthetase catalytic domain-containing protein (RelA/SpoT-type nucleotidyltransferase) n=1 Tax=Williamsia serinedens TaxID=391736 RepID=A0ABT1H1U8_9NOCA|nr:GTP pyrophosphokinase family protein [Williamsia serinedens]MCP2160959.1 ppGpp synthetase catalytic domain-containing protein (RelA/SpoT-type nucleotidyltransferase) [Williamsia serinedens]